MLWTGALPEVVSSLSPQSQPRPTDDLRDLLFLLFSGTGTTDPLASQNQSLE
jgi:hypothetical protein